MLRACLRTQGRSRFVQKCQAAGSMTRASSPFLREPVRIAARHVSKRREVMQFLNISKFDDVEIESTFRQLADGKATITVEQLREKVKSMVENDETIPTEMRNAQTDMICDRLLGVESSKQRSVDISPDMHISLQNFHSTMITYGDKIDSRIKAVQVSYILTGLSVGVILPCFPELVKVLELSPLEVGLIVGSFAGAKLMSNIPIAYFVDTVGRKSSMIAGLLFSSAGLGLVGVSLTPGVPVLPWLMSCRLINGVGVSAFIAGAQLFAADVSTNLNRAKTFAPLNIAFQLGFTIGPMVGAFGISQLGIPMTFASCGTALASVAVYNHFAVTETLVRSTTSAPSSSCVNKQPDDMSRTANASEEISSAFRAAYSSWGQLLKNTGVRDISLVTGAYWFALSGVQFTILPQLFILPEFQLTAVGISCIYMTMSSTQFLSASKIAQFADHSGKPPVIFAGGAMMTAALVGLPFADSFMGLIGVSVPLALGATVLSVIPHSLLIDMVSVRDQAQAQSLLRTCGDIGMLTGSITTGLMMSVFNTENAIMVNTAIVAASMGYYAKEYILNKGTVPVVTRDMERRTENSIDAQAQDSGKQRNSNEEFDMHRPKLVMKQQTDEKEFIEPRFRHDS